MPYRINRLRVKNFKCFDNKKYYSFNFDKKLNPIILSGPNGFGKTTFFDAIELIFTKNITRLNKDIEDGRINLGKNILLNEANGDGVLVADLSDENDNILTIVTVIGHQNEKLLIENSIKYSTINEPLHSDEDIEVFLRHQHEWKWSLADCNNKMKYSLDHFNVYYYVSQAESVHFLKKSVSERKNSVNTLLNTDAIHNHIDYIERSLIGASKSKKDVIVNDAITSSKAVIEEKAKLIRAKMEEFDVNLQSTEYEQLLNYDGPCSIPWDFKEISVNPDNTKVSLNKITNEIQALHCFVNNSSDYAKYLENKEIKKLIGNKTGIDDFIKYYNFIKNGVVNDNQIRELSLLNSQKVNVYNHSEFFRKELNLSSFRKEDLLLIKEIDANIISSDINEISDSVKAIVDAEKELSDNQKLINELNNARTELHKYTNMLADTGSCPFCSHQFASAHELEEAFLNLSDKISKNKTSDSEKIDKLFHELNLKLEDDSQKILEYIQDLDEQEVRELSLSVTKNQQFIDNTERIKIVEKIYSYFNLDSSWVSLNDNEKPLAIERFLQEKVKPYTNPEFESNFKKYDFQKIAEKHKNILSLNQDRIAKKECVDKKINYLRYIYSLSENAEITRLRLDLKNEIIKKHKLEFLRGKLDNLKLLYKNSVNAYKNQVIKKLRIPLLIYTGKILQDYQNGLGVFISKDEMRFVSSGDAKHDILNTFSSGQLSGFVLSFLFAMNKQYITNSNDDIGFILVDDPVQTMDDINIASLIEVLRNDFPDKQLILSTHENDKENYILYKFLKYNLCGLSFNVKDKLYL